MWRSVDTKHGSVVPAQPRLSALRCASGESGQAIAEFALLASVLMLLVLGIGQLGITLSNYVTLTDAVRVGARAAAVAPANPCDAATTAVVARLPSAAVTCTGFSPGQPFTVTATYPYEINLIGLVVASGSLTSKSTERKEG